MSRTYGDRPPRQRFSNCLGYSGQIYEDRHGQYQITYHTDGANSDAAGVEGTVFAVFRISPLGGHGVVYTGSYREHSAGTFKTTDGRDVPYPSATYLIHGDGTPAPTDQRFASQEAATSSWTENRRRAARLIHGRVRPRVNPGDAGC